MTSPCLHRADSVTRIRPLLAVAITLALCGCSQSDPVPPARLTGASAQALVLSMWQPCSLAIARMQAPGGALSAKAACNKARFALSAANVEGLAGSYCADAALQAEALAAKSNDAEVGTQAAARLQTATNAAVEARARCEAMIDPTSYNLVHYSPWPNLVAKTVSKTTSPPPSTREIGRICRAAIGALMVRDPSHIKLDRVTEGVAHVRYSDPEGRVWRNRCRVGGGTVHWGTVGLSGQGNQPGRWRIGPEDEVVAYALDGASVRIRLRYPDGSATEKTYTVN